MSYLKIVNKARRKITQSLTNGIGTGRKNKAADSGPIDVQSVKRILISRPNHRLGNMLLITPIVQEVTTIFPNAKIDIFVKGTVANIIFENFENVDRIICLPKKHFNQLNQYINGWLQLKSQKYDLVINCIENSSSGRLSTQISKGTHKYFGPEVTLESTANSGDEFTHFAKRTINGLRKFLINKNVTIYKTEIPTLNLKLSKSEIEAGKIALEQIINNGKKTISLFTYATGAKCYSEEWWSEFYSLLVQNFPEYNFIEILPVENISKLNFTIASYYSKEVREICSVIANTELFIGADSGMMHLASASLATTIGLFSVTNVAMYAPYGNHSTAIDTNVTSHEDAMIIIRETLEKRVS